MSETAGLKCAPLMGPKSAISVASAATVAAVLAKQRHRKIAARESLGHDSGTNHGRRQQHRPQSFGDKRPA